MGLDPISAVAGIGQTLLGIGQTIFSGKKKAERNLENYADTFQPNHSIMDYYNKALSRYSTNPYSSTLYNKQKLDIDRNTATGIGALQDRRSALGGISSLVAGANDASLKAATAAEGQQSQEFSQLGNATQMKAAEDAKKFDIKYNLLASKASGANANKSAGIQNIGGGLQSLAQMGIAKNMYKQ